MAATVTTPAPQTSQQSIGSLHGTVIRVTLATNDYVTGGIDLSSLIPSGSLIGGIILQSTGAGAVVQIPVFDVATKKLLLMIGAAGVNVQAANGSSTAQVVDILVLTA
jgi:hypothetical protein